MTDQSTVIDLRNFVPVVTKAVCSKDHNVVVALVPVNPDNALEQITDLTQYHLTEGGMLLAITPVEDGRPEVVTIREAVAIHENLVAELDGLLFGGGFVRINRAFDDLDGFDGVGVYRATMPDGHSLEQRVDMAMLRTFEDVQRFADGVTSSVGAYLEMLRAAVDLIEQMEQYSTPTIHMRTWYRQLIERAEEPHDIILGRIKDEIDPDLLDGLSASIVDFAALHLDAPGVDVSIDPISLAWTLYYLPSDVSDDLTAGSAADEDGQSPPADDKSWHLALAPEDAVLAEKDLQELDDGVAE